jgi:hypothetical protein
VLEQAILDLQIIERSVAAKTLPNLEIRLALRRCLKELRTLAADSPRRHDEQAEFQDAHSLAHRVPFVAL